jgi:hypothetical protein
MAKLIDIDWYAGGSLVINVDDVYRVDAKDADEMYLYYNIAAGSGPEIWTATLKFSASITDDDVTELQKAILSIQQSPQAMVKFKLPSEGKLDGTTPFAVAAGATPK